MLQQRQLDGELAALTDTGAVHLDRALVHLDQPQRQRETHAKPRLCTVKRDERQQEQQKEDSKENARYAYTVVLDDDHHARADELGPELYFSVGVGVFGGIVEQIREDLREPRLVAVKIDRAGRQSDLQLMTAAVDHRACDLDGVLDDLVQFNLLFFQHELAGGDARDVE